MRVKKITVNTIEDLPEAIQHKMEFLLSERIILKRFIEVKDIRNLSKRIKLIAESGELSRMENCYLLGREICKLDQPYLRTEFNRLTFNRNKLLGLYKTEEKKTEWKVLPDLGKVLN